MGDETASSVSIPDFYGNLSFVKFGDRANKDSDCNNDSEVR